MRANLDRAVCALTFGALGPLAFFAPKGLWIPILLFLLAKSKMLMSVTPHDYRRIIGGHALFLILPAYGVLSAVWAVVPIDSAITSGKLFGYFLAAMAVILVIDRLSDSEKRSVITGAAAGTILAGLFVWADLGTAGSLTSFFREYPFTANFYSRGAAIAACVAVPLFAGLSRLSENRWAFVFAGIGIVTILVLENEAAKLAVLFSWIAYAAVRWRRVLFWPIVLVPFVAGLLAPIYFSYALSNTQLCSLYNSKPSAAHRLMIYEFASRKIFEKPVIGWGMDSSRSIPDGEEGAKIYACEFKGGRSQTLTIGGQIPLHPHNASLQVWLELGAVGVVIFLGLLGVLIRRLQRGFAAGDGRPLIAGALTAIVVIYNISFGLWQSWLIFALILLCAIVRALSPSGPVSRGGVSG